MNLFSIFSIPSLVLSSFVACLLMLSPCQVIAAIQCYECHGTRNPIDFRPVDSSYRNISSGGFAGSHRTHMGPSATQASCNPCHSGASSYETGHRDGKIQLGANLNGSPHPDGAGYVKGGTRTAFFNQTSLPVLGICSNVNCHFETATPTWGAQPFSAPGDCGKCHSANPVSGSHPGSGGKHANYGCSICHPSHTTFGHATSQRLTIQFFQPPNNGGTYSGELRRFLPSQSIVENYGSCSGVYCHSNGKGRFSAPEWGNNATGQCGSCHETDSIASNGHTAHLVAAYGPRLSGRGVPTGCQSCHSYTAELSATHVDGSVQSPSANCTTSCHRNAFPAWSGGRVSCESCHTGNLSVINGITAPAKASFTTTGHGQAGTNYDASRACSSCHDNNSPHIDGIANSTKRITTTDPTLCESCHNDPVKVPTETKRNLKTHVNAPDGLSLMTCSTCHDSHGAANFSMLRTRIRFNNLSASIVFSNLSSGFVQTTPPYNGFCQACHTQTRVFKAGVAQSDFKLHISFTLPTMKCIQCHSHSDSYAFRPRSYSVAMSMASLYPWQRRSGMIYMNDELRANNKYPNQDFMSLDNSCTGCHQSYGGQATSSRHSDRGFSVASGRGYDPARPWVLGPGSFGSWSPLHNRQFPDLKAKFANMSSFSRRVDLPVVEYLQECGSCHVGGGPTQINRYYFSASSWYRWDFFSTPMKKLPGYNHAEIDNPDREESLAFQYSPLVNTRLVPISAWDYFIPGSSIPATLNNVMDGNIATTNWRDQGALERDCFMCHLDGYNHLKRNEQIVRYGYYGNASGVGSGATESDISMYDGFINYYTSYLYPTINIGTETAGYLRFDRSFIDRINRHTPSVNCAACHIPTKLEGEDAATRGDAWKQGFLVAEAVPSDTPDDPDPIKAANKRPATLRSDYLNRGDVWRSADDEAHPFICSRCHSKTGKIQTSNAAAPDFKHDPGKGHDPLRWPDDPLNDTVKYCEDCHLRKGDLNGDGIQEMAPYGAADGRSSHEKAGLLANIVPNAMRIKDGSGAEETFLGNHLDVISCTACHVNKQYAAARSVDFSTGGQYYNFVGNPGSLTPVADAVPLAYSWRENTTQKLINGTPNPYWRRQIFPFNYLTGIYWNNVGPKDANGDGFTTGANNNGTTVIGDPFFARTIKAFFSYSTVNSRNNRVASGMAGSSSLGSRSGWSMVNDDGAVTFTQPAEITAFRQNMAAANPGFVPQLRLEAQPNLVMHNVMPKGKGLALGRPKELDANGQVVTYGCNDCHGNSGGVYKGAYNLLGNGTPTTGGSVQPLAVSWNSAGDVTAKAVYWERNGGTSYIDFSSGTSTRQPQRWEFLGYDTGRVNTLDSIAPASYGFGMASVTSIQTTGSGASFTANFTTMPVHTRILIDWGDGTGQWVDGSGDIMGISHSYSRTAPYYNGVSGKFEFLLYLQVFDGTARKEGKLLRIQIP